MREGGGGKEGEGRRGREGGGREGGREGTETQRDESKID